MSKMTEIVSNLDLKTHIFYLYAHPSHPLMGVLMGGWVGMGATRCMNISGWLSYVLPTTHKMQLFVDGTRRVRRLSLR